MPRPLRPIFFCSGLLVFAVVLFLNIAQVEPPRKLPMPVSEQIMNYNQQQAKDQDNLVIIKTETVQASKKSTERKVEKPRMPVPGRVVYDFGWNVHPVYKDWRYHTGVDIVAAAEIDPGVLAALSGTVTQVYTDSKTGLTIAIESDSYTIIYGSLGKVMLKPGTQVKQGDKIGTIGQHSSEPYMHLHIAVKNREKYLNPLEILK